MVSLPCVDDSAMIVIFYTYIYKNELLLVAVRPHSSKFPEAAAL